MCHPQDLIYEGRSFVIMKTLFMRAGVCHPEDLIYEGVSVILKTLFMRAGVLSS